MAQNHSRHPEEAAKRLSRRTHGIHPIRRQLLGSLIIAALALIAAMAPAGAFEREGDRKVLVYSGGQPVPVLDPHVRYDWSTRMAQQSFYDALAKYTGNPPQLGPWLAEKWESNPDATEWTFHLVHNAKFHNGDPVDAEAVKYSYVRGLKLNKGIAWMLKDFLAPEGIEAVDAYTVRFKLKKPYAAFISFVPWWYIVNPKEVGAHEEDGDSGQKWLTEHEAGSGPFKMARWETNTLYEAAAVPDYWRGWPQGADKRLGGFIYRIIREAAPRKAALARGEVDFVTELTPDDYDELAKNPDFVVPNEKGMTTFGIKFNNQSGPTADINLRKAIAYAIDYDDLIAIYNGKASLETSPFPPAIKGYEAVAGIPRKDLAKAKEFLAKVPAAAKGLELDYVYVQGLEEERRIGLVLLNALQPLGIKVNLVTEPWPTLVARGSKLETSPNMSAVFVTPVSTDPDVIAYQYHKNSWGQYFGLSFYNDPQVWAETDEARAEPDWAKRAPLYKEIQEQIVADQPEVFGMMANRQWAYHNYVKGFDYSPIRLTGEVDMYPLWIDAK
jgi:peptide/nickel transport system substrate-binding protein